MSETNAAPGAASAATAEKDPFADFTTESFVGGEPESVNPAVAGNPASASPETPEAELEGEGAEAHPVTDPAPKKQTVQERINELTRARREAERREDDLRRQLEEMRAAPKPAPTPVAPPAAAAAEKGAAKGPPRPDDFEYGELDSEYIAAVVDYQTEKRLTEFREALQQDRQQAEAETRQHTVQQKFQQQIEAGRQKHADYDEVVVQGAQAGTWPLSETMALLLVESEVGDDIAYHLASNPDEAENVDRLTPVEQARYFGRLEAKFSAVRAAATGEGDLSGKPVTTRVPKAPAPIVPARGAGGRFQANASTDDFAAFEAAANGK